MFQYGWSLERRGEVRGEQRLGDRGFCSFQVLDFIFSVMVSCWEGLNWRVIRQDLRFKILAVFMVEVIFDFFWVQG